MKTWKSSQSWSQDNHGSTLVSSVNQAFLLVNNLNTATSHWCKMYLPTLTWFFQSFIILSFLQSSQSKPAQVSQNFKIILWSAKIFHSLTRLFMNHVWFGQIFSDIVSWQGASLLHQTFRHQPTSLFLLVNPVNTVLWLVGCQESVDE